MRLAASQHGVVSRAQLLACGLGTGAIDWRLASKRIRRLHRGVYLLAPLEYPLSHPMAAVLACPGSVVSHVSAAHLHGLLGPPQFREVHVSVGSGQPATRPGLVVHRVGDLPADERTVREAIAVTSVARTLLDLAATQPRAGLERAVAEGLRRGLVTEAALGSILSRHHGRSGTVALRAILSGGEPSFTRSEAERRLLSLLRRAELPRPRVNQRLRGFEVDLLWSEQRLVVEVDGYAFHSDRRAFERDRERDGVLAASGYLVIRVSWKALTNRPEATVARIAAALARR